MIQHRFKNTQFKEREGFYTENCILKTPYQPKVLFLGTFNPNTDTADNKADFFYGRNYLWPLLFNMFKYKENKYTSMREDNDLIPRLSDILDFCKEHELTFADLISEVLHNGSPKYEISKRKSNIIWYDRDCFDLINDKDLARLAKEKQVNIVADQITAFLKVTTSIKAVYFTMSKPGGIYKKLWKKIKDEPYKQKVIFKEIFTPSGQGAKRGRGKGKTLFIANEWLSQFDQNWLATKSVDRSKFIL